MSWVTHVIHNVVHTVTDTGKSAEHLVKDIGGGALDLTKRLGHEVTREVFDVTDFGLDAIDLGFQQLGVKGSVNFLKDVSTGLEYTTSGVIDGDPESIAMAAVIAISIASGVGALSNASMWSTAGSDWAEIVASGSAAAMSSADVAYTSFVIAQELASIVSSVYGVYTTAEMVATLGEEIQNYGTGAIYDFLNSSYKKSKAIQTSYLNSFIDGSINDWMAGGKLYDAPRAGNIMFNVLGNMNTVRFLGREDTNKIPDMVSEFTNPELFRSLGNMPGDKNFSVISPAIYS